MNRRTQQRAETRTLLLTAARDVLDTHGYDQASIKVVAKAAGVAVGTVYTHFDSKAALAEATFQEDIRRTIGEAWATLPPDSPRRQLVHIGEQLLRYYSQRPALSKALLRAVLFSDRPDPMTPAFIAQLTELLTTAQRRGELRNSADVTAAAHNFFAAYFLILIGGLAGHLGPLPAQIDALTRQVDLLFDGIGP
jgi:AcrR family transcriptional regulator